MFAKKGKAAVLFCAVVLCGALFAGCGAKAAAAPQAEAVRARPDADVVVLYTNDVHCGTEDGQSYAAVADCKKQLAADGSHVLLVDAGDAVQGAPIGTLSRGQDLIDIMNTAGYDISAVGNHEFDYGMDQFFALTKEAQFPYVCTNFYNEQTGKRVLDAYRVFEVGGVKLAFVGVTTPRTLATALPEAFQDESGALLYGFCQDKTGEALYSEVQQSVDAARAEGADYVVLLSHLGVSGTDAPWMSTDVIANTTGIDVVLDGHSHTELECERVQNKDGTRVLLSQTGTKLDKIGMLVLTKEGNLSTGLLSNWQGEDVETAARIAELQAAYESQLSEPVAQTEVNLYITDPATGVRIVRNAETNLGDLCADAYRAVTGADVALLNGGNVRVDWPKGTLTYGDVLELFPFNNSVCMVRATGQQILDALEMGARSVPEENGGFLQVSGLTYEINTDVASTVQVDENGMFVSVDGARRVQNVRVGDTPLNLTAEYTVASHDYMLKSGGDGLNMFVNAPIVADNITVDNQLLTDYLRQTLGGTVGQQYADPYGDGRIVAVTGARAG